MEEFNWEISIKELESDIGTMYKLTKRTSSSAETKIFYTKELALRQFKEWLK
jgi:hypothetical protein